MAYTSEIIIYLASPSLNMTNCYASPSSFSMTTEVELETLTLFSVALSPIVKSLLPCKMSWSNIVIISATVAVLLVVACSVMDVILTV